MCSGKCDVRSSTSGVCGHTCAKPDGHDGKCRCELSLRLSAKSLTNLSESPRHVIRRRRS